MSTECARTIIRLIALTTILVGAAVTTIAIIGLIAWGRATIAVTNQEWSGTSMGFFTILSHASIIGWGLVLYIASPRLAELATK